jgi:hypothetical protein
MFGTWLYTSSILSEEKTTGSGTNKAFTAIKRSKKDKTKTTENRW